MIKRHYFLWFLILSTAYSACKKEPNPGNGPGNPVPTDTLGTTQIEVIVPAGSSFKPAGSKVFSYGKEQTVDASGKASVTFEKGSATLAYVFDANKKLVLAGFITDSTKTISPATTAKVLLYLGYNIPLQPDTLSVYFLNNIDKLAGAKEWEQEFEGLFAANPLLLSDTSFVAPLRARMAKMIDQKPAIDIRGKLADIHVDANDIKSGLQVSDDGLSKFKIVNAYRRRAHAFLYKMSYEDISGTSHIIKQKVDAGTKADLESPVEAVSGVTGFFSEIGKVIEGEDLKSFSVTSGPFDMELKDEESAAKYKLRIIGPGNTGKPGLTNEETSRLETLEMETFLLDIVIPAVSIITSKPEKPDPDVMPDVELLSKSDALLSLVKTMPDVYAEVKNANYKSALKKFFENIAKDGSGVLIKALFQIALDREGTADGVRVFLNQRIEYLLYILSLTDAALGASDLIRITSHALASSVMEEWDINAKSSQVKLNPDQAVVIPYQQQKLTAEIKNLTQAGYYEWSTSGKYGKLSDTRGHTNQLSFSSQDKDVFYVSTADASNLTDGDNLEYIYVTAYIGSTKVGTDTAVINVKKDRYMMKPNGVTLSGRNENYNSVKLYLEKINGTNNIAPNNDFSYKVVWTTPGTYGKLFSPRVKGVTTITLYDNNAAFYICLDGDTKTATETIDAKIYIKPKAAPESEYKLFDEVSGTVKIDNDPKKRILHVPVFELHGDTSFMVGTQKGYNCAKEWAARFAEDKNALSYKVVFRGAKGNKSDATYTWKAGFPSPGQPTNYAGLPFANGVYTIVWGSGSYFNGWTAEHANGVPPSGDAEVTIFLK